jgi:YHS domain-containing protein
MIAELGDARIRLIEWSNGEIQTQYERLSAAINNMPLGLCMFDAGQNLIVCNQRYAEIYGVSEEQLELIDVQAGIDIGGRTPAEIALSIVAQIVAVRRGKRIAASGDAYASSTVAPSADAPSLAIDPICGMTVAAVPGTPSVQVDGETIYFCCEGCAATFQAQREHALAAE